MIQKDNNDYLDKPVWLDAVKENIFPKVDVSLRSGQHISSEQVELYLFINKYLNELIVFFKRYGAELIKGAESYYYLRLQPNSLITRGTLNTFEVLVGKILCMLYLSPEKLNENGVFNQEDVIDKLFDTTSKEKILKFTFPRAGGSELDLIKLTERIKSSLIKLKKIRMITYIDNKYFKIHDPILRFASDAKDSDNIENINKELINSGEAIFYNN